MREMTTEMLIAMALSGGGGGGGGGTADTTLKHEIKVSNSIGRYAAGDTIPAGTQFEAIFNSLLTKTSYPTLTDPSVALNYGVPALVKVGASVPAAAATIAFDRGSINPQYTAESPYRSGAASSYAVELVNADITYSDSNTDGAPFSVPSFTRSTAGVATLNAAVSYAEGVQPKDSDGGNYKSPLPAGSKTASKSVEFILPFYYGKSANGTIDSLAGFAEDLTKKGQKVYTYNVDNEYMYMAYSAAYGNLTSILDENNFENLDSWVKSSLTYEGQSYNVYRSGYAITGQSVKFTFKF